MANVQILEASSSAKSKEDVFKTTATFVSICEAGIIVNIVISIDV